MCFRLVPKSLTLNDRERRNDCYSVLIHPIRRALSLRLLSFLFDI